MITAAFCSVIGATWMYGIFLVVVLKVVNFLLMQLFVRQKKKLV